MDSNVYRFDKSFEERLTEYTFILTKADNTKLFGSRVLLAWSEYLELMMEPSGWKAMWNMSRKSCLDLQINFPALVIVRVSSTRNVFFNPFCGLAFVKDLQNLKQFSHIEESSVNSCRKPGTPFSQHKILLEEQIEYIDFCNLTANVTITEVEDTEKSDKLPVKVKGVPLKEFYVTLNQDVNGPDYQRTAEVLDQFRLFYNHLWWPWDEDTETYGECWMSAHCQERLRLYYDMMHGNLHYVTGKIIKNLIESGKQLHSKIDELRNELSMTDDEDTFEDQQLVEIINCTGELDVIKSKLMRWEVPRFRKALNIDIAEKNCSPGIHIVNLQSPMSEAFQNFSEVSQLTNSDELFKSAPPTLSEAIVSYVSQDKILITPGLHLLPNSEMFDQEITIRGLYPEKKTVIADDRSHWSVMESFSSATTIQDLTLNVQFCRTGITIKRGTTYLKSVVIENKGKNALNAILVDKNATLIAIGCTFVNFKEAVVALECARVELRECTFRWNDTCLQINRNADVHLENCDLSKNQTFEIQLKGFGHQGTRAGLDYLSKFDGIKITSVKVQDPSKALEFL